MTRFIRSKSLLLSYSQKLIKLISRENRISLVQLVLLAAFTALLEFKTITFLPPIIKAFAESQNNILDFNLLFVKFSFVDLSSACIFYIILLVFSASFRIYTLHFQYKTSAKITCDLSETVFRSVLSKRYEWHLTNNTSQVIGYLTKDIDQVNQSIQSLIALAVNISIAIFIVIALLSISIKLMVIFLPFVVAFYSIIYLFVQYNLRENGKKVTLNYQLSVKTIQESLGSIRDVIIDKMASYFEDDFKKFITVQRNSGAKIKFLLQSPRYLIESSIIICTVLAIFIFNNFNIQIQPFLPLLGGLSLAFFKILQPIQLCFSSLGTIRANYPSFQKIEPFLTSKTNSNFASSLENKSIHDEYHERGSILVECKNLCYKYPGTNEYAVSNINISLARNSSIAIVGTSGSGKTTLCDLLLGLLEPSSGNVSFKAQDQNGLIRSPRLSHVPQNIYLVEGTLLENIAFGELQENINYENVCRSATLAMIDEFIMSMPQQYHSKVGEQGASLSGGQRQRIGIARAIYKDADFLVLDEATSALDSNTESKIVDSIKNLSSGKTIVMISHNLSTIKHCNNILVMNKGKIYSQGTFEELKRGCKVFNSLLNSSEVG